MKARVLIVEDEDLMREVIKDYFEHDGYKCYEAKDGDEALAYLNSIDFDLVLLDIMLPGTDGYTVCREIRRKSAVPVIMITARSQEYDKLTGYEAGADMYITKPFSPKVLLATSAAVIRRANGTVCGNSDEVIGGGIVINTLSHTVMCGEEEIDLTPKEYELLLFLIKNKGKVFSRDVLLSKIWGYDYFGDDRTLDTHIKLLRKSLGEYSDYIVTLRGVGYRFDAEK